MAIARLDDLERAAIGQPARDLLLLPKGIEAIGIHPAHDRGQRRCPRARGRCRACSSPRSATRMCRRRNGWRVWLPGAGGSSRWRSGHRSTDSRHPARNWRTADPARFPFGTSGARCAERCSARPAGIGRCRGSPRPASWDRTQWPRSAWSASRSDRQLPWRRPRARVPRPPAPGCPRSTPTSACRPWNLRPRPPNVRCPERRQGRPRQPPGPGSRCRGTRCPMPARRLRWNSVRWCHRNRRERWVRSHTIRRCRSVRPVRPCRSTSPAAHGRRRLARSRVNHRSTRVRSTRRCRGSGTAHPTAAPRS